MKETIDCKVVMLPGKTSTGIWHGVIQHKDKLCWGDLACLANGDIPQHLYFTSMEFPKDGDWFILHNGPYTNELRQRVGKSISPCKEAVVKSATDPSLGLPTIPESWIKDVYVPSNGKITDVKLRLTYKINANTGWKEYELFTTANNEVCIVEDAYKSPLEAFQERNSKEAQKIVENVMSIVEDKQPDIQDRNSVEGAAIVAMATTSLELSSLDSINNALIECFKKGVDWQKQQPTTDSDIEWNRTDEQLTKECMLMSEKSLAKEWNDSDIDALAEADKIPEEQRHLHKYPEGFDQNSDIAKLSIEAYPLSGRSVNNYNRAGRIGWIKGFTAAVEKLVTPEMVQNEVVREAHRKGYIAGRTGMWNDKDLIDFGKWLSENGWSANPPIWSNGEALSDITGRSTYDEKTTEELFEIWKEYKRTKPFRTIPNNQK